MYNIIFLEQFLCKSLRRCSIILNIHSAQVLAKYTRYNLCIYTLNAKAVLSREWVFEKVYKMRYSYGKICNALKKEHIVNWKGCSCRKSRKNYLYVLVKLRKCRPSFQELFQEVFYIRESIDMYVNLTYLRTEEYSTILLTYMHFTVQCTSTSIPQ